MHDESKTSTHPTLAPNTPTHPPPHPHPIPPPAQQQRTSSPTTPASPLLSHSAVLAAMVALLLEEKTSSKAPTPPPLPLAWCLPFFLSCFDDMAVLLCGYGWVVGGQSCVHVWKRKGGTGGEATGGQATLAASRMLGMNKTTTAIGSRAHVLHLNVPARGPAPCSVFKR